MDPLVGKCIRSTSDISLKNKLVDGKLCSNNSCYIPRIKQGDSFRVKECDRGIVILQNLNSDMWKECELTEDEIGDWKIISSYSI